MPENMVVPEYVRQNLDASVPRPEAPNRGKGRGGGRRPGSGGPGFKVVKAERNARMAALFADGQTLKQIGERIGLAPSTISQQIDDYVRKLEEQALEHVSRRIARSEAVYRYVQLEAHLAWIRSQNPEVITSTKTVKELRAVARSRRKNVPRQKLTGPLDEAFGVDEDDIDLDGVAPAGVTEEEGKRKKTSVGEAQFLRLIMDSQDKIDELRNNKPKRDGGEGSFGNEELKRLTIPERAKKIQGVVDKLKLKLAQQMALGEYTVIDVPKAVPALPAARPFARQPIPEAPRTVNTEVEEWLL